MVYSVVEVFFSPRAVKWGPENCAREFGDSLGIPVSVKNACYVIRVRDVHCSRHVSCIVYAADQ